MKYLLQLVVWESIWFVPQGATFHHSQAKKNFTADSQPKIIGRIFVMVWVKNYMCSAKHLKAYDWWKAANDDEYQSRY